ncbi:MAG: 2Fe-2S iron-sulfur cluster binding domain-containing protein [Selenomonas ruminantium]|nr:2Fe-2S iron-sulfur cluster binding domain-containing protein [Selenomonas ruminantium]
MNKEAEVPTVNLTINNIPLKVPKGTKIMQAAKEIGIDIPHLCYHEDQRIKAHCRLCSVEVTGRRRLLAACSTEVWEGMEVHTDTPIVRDTQVAILQLMLANHHKDCLSCPRNQNCDLQQLCSRFNIMESHLPSVVKDEPRIVTNPAIVRDPSKCIRCGRCIRACKDVQGIAALTYAHRSSDITVTTAYDKPMERTDCVLCGQCSLVCPTGAIVEKDDTDAVLDALQDPRKHVIVQVAPSVRVALGDAFGMEPGEIVTGQMVTALKLLGFDKVFDTNFGADLTIMEEGSEFLHRLEHGGTFPMITSCSPGWVNFLEKNFGDFTAHLSTAKSPMSMFGAIAKTYYPEKAGIPVEDIVTVSIMPCTAKKYEAARPEMGRDGRRDVDIVLTTRELIKLIKYVGLTFQKLPESDFDSPLGVGTGAGAIFGATGGVMEAALRTVYEKYTGKTLERLDFHAVRGFEGIKEAEVDLGDRKVRVAIAHTLKNARLLMEQVQKHESPYDFIEIMACPGGCIGGGGQPIGTTNAIRKKRMAALYEIDKNLPLRKSHENPEIITLYKEFLGEPLGEKAHELLHTHYHKVEKEYTF